MTKVLLLALSLPLVACTVGDGSSPMTGGGGDDTGSDTGSATGSDTGSGGTPLSGTITADVTWSGTMQLLDTVTIPAGVTVTVAAGTTVQSGTATDAGINIAGTLLENGAKGSVVTFDKVGLEVAAGGTVTATYAVHTGGGIELVTGATVTLTDTMLSHAEGDFLVMTGGTVTVDHSQIGVGLPTDTARGVDTTHCDMHFNDTAGSVMKINNSNIASSSYGIMLYVSGADLSNNNWYGNTNDFEPGVSGVSGGIADGGWFEAAAGSTTYMPAGVQGVTFANLAAAPIPGNGPR